MCQFVGKLNLISPKTLWLVSVVNWHLDIDALIRDRFPTKTFFNLWLFKRKSQKERIGIENFDLSYPTIILSFTFALYIYNMYST